MDDIKPLSSLPLAPPPIKLGRFDYLHLNATPDGYGYQVSFRVHGISFEATCEGTPVFEAEKDQEIRALRAQIAALELDRTKLIRLVGDARLALQNLARQAQSFDASMGRKASDYLNSDLETLDSDD